MRPYEIYFAKVTWKGCPDERPWVIVEQLPNDLFGCFPISGSCYGESCFPVDESHPDFAATGLTKTSYIHDASVIDLHVSRFNRRKGELTNELLADFLDFTGLRPPP